jgi:hypothetical protein
MSLHHHHHRHHHHRCLSIDHPWFSHPCVSNSCCRPKGMVGIGWDHSYNCYNIVRAWCLVSIVSAFDIVVTYCAYCLSLWARVPWSQIWTCYCFMKIIVVCDLTCKLYTHIVVRNPRPQSESNWDNWRGWLWCEDYVCSRSINALLRYSIRRSTLITSSFPWAPAANRLVG